MTPRMNARTIVPCALLLLACPRPTDHDKTDGAADGGSTDTGGVSAPEPKPAEPDPEPAASESCAAEIEALKTATARVEQCVAGL